jgi:putative endopeptidase
MDTPMISGLDTSSFSTTIDPADDLFRFANGPWIDTFEMPADRSRYGNFDRLAEQSDEQIHEILEDPDCKAAKSQALYRSFLDTEAIEAAGISPIAESLKAIDEVTDKVAMTRLMGMQTVTGGTDLFGMTVEANPSDPSSDRRILWIGQGGIGLPDEAYYREDRYAGIRAKYVDMMTRMLTLAGDDETEARDKAERVMAFETRIASHHFDNVTERDPQKTFNLMNFEQLQAMMPNFDMATWVDAAQQAYDATPTAKLLPANFTTAFSYMNVMEPPFFQGLDREWAAASLDDIKLWTRVHTIIGAASYLNADFDHASFDFYGKVLSGSTEQRDRWKRGVSLVNGLTGEDIGQEYVRRHFPASSKQRMQELVDNIIEAYRVSINGSDWLSEETKAKALDKLSKFKPMIGYTNHWRDYSALDVSNNKGLIDNIKAASTYGMGYMLSRVGLPVDREEWEMNPQTVNAYYEPTMNVIVFPAAILQPPFFNPDADDAANYGGIGTVIGHEIGHGFDDQGSQFDGEGNLNDWWTADDKANFQNRTKALIEQYNALTPSQLVDKYADDPTSMPHVNGALTTGENIGDLSGVNIALKAYAFALDASRGQKKEDSAESIERSLEAAPVIDGYTGLQRFFLSYATIWRCTKRDEICEQYLQIDPHSPEEFRSNQISRNVDLFYKAFDVTPGNGMWLAPELRVHIW